MKEFNLDVKNMRTKNVLKKHLNINNYENTNNNNHKNK